MTGSIIFAADTYLERSKVEATTPALWDCLSCKGGYRFLRFQLRYPSHSRYSSADITTNCNSQNLYIKRRRQCPILFS